MNSDQAFKYISLVLKNVKDSLPRLDDVASIDLKTFELQRERVRGGIRELDLILQDWLLPLREKNKEDAWVGIFVSILVSFLEDCRAHVDEWEGSVFKGSIEDFKRLEKRQLEITNTARFQRLERLMNSRAARNSEKAQSMLFRFRAQQAADLGIIDAGRSRRPKVITEVNSIPLCEKWRGQVLKEISRKVSKIQDPSLSDYQIRDLNDEINKAMREKHMWEVQIRNLGGPNYMRGGGKVYDEEGREIPGGGKGYRYFGRARELPGVRELFESTKPKPPPDKPLESRSDLRKQVDASYYGYNLDEEDGTLLEYEKKKEQDASESLKKSGEGKAPPGWEPLPGDAGDGKVWRIPTSEEVQEELVERRRRRLLEKLG